MGILHLSLDLQPLSHPAFQFPPLRQQLGKLSRELFPAFLLTTTQRHVTRQKILNWKQALRFPTRPAVSHEGINLMQQLLCEPEDRLGSQTPSSTLRPNSLVVHARRSGFVTQPSVPADNDGVHLIKVWPAFWPSATLASADSDTAQAHPWFKGIDWQNIHRYPAPYRPELISPDDTRHFDDDIPPEVRMFVVIFFTCRCFNVAFLLFQPLAPANGAPADATRDPMLRHKVHGAEIMDVRKALAFAGFTHKSPRAVDYARADRAFEDPPVPQVVKGTVRGRPLVRETRDIGLGRAISM